MTSMAPSKSNESSTRSNGPPRLPYVGEALNCTCSAGVSPAVRWASRPPFQIA